jgi:DNA uptake protein ComE-like DNA-binding protein
MNSRLFGLPEQVFAASKKTMKTMMLAGVVVLFGLVGCNNQSSPTPDQIRENTAKATAEAVRDTKAVAKGVADGIKQTDHDRRVDINKASVDDLKTLPGVDDMRAQSIVDGRPYDNTGQLVSKHVVSQAEYDRIAGQIKTQ